MRGFYDGSSLAIHNEQIDEISGANIGGIALYHYWFYNKRELHAFEDTLLSNARAPWFLIWANESWTKRWIGDSTTIVSLTRSPSYDQVLEHVKHIGKCMRHECYFKVSGKPLFVFYNVTHFEDPSKVIKMYRYGFESLGIKSFLMQYISSPIQADYSFLFDGAFLFEPRLFFAHCQSFRSSSVEKINLILGKYLSQKIYNKIINYYHIFSQKGINYHSDMFIQYLRSNARKCIVDKLQGSIQNILSPGWNNVPRYNENFTALADISPQIFASLLYESSQTCPDIPVLINAWNEWSEGAAIEPCFYYGHEYLDSIRNAFK